MIVFKLEYALLYQFYPKISIFFIKKSLVRLLSMASCTRSSYLPLCKRWKYPERVNWRKPCQACKKTKFCLLACTYLLRPGNPSFPVTIGWCCSVANHRCHLKNIAAICTLHYATCSGTGDSVLHLSKE